MLDRQDLRFQSAYLQRPVVKLPIGDPDLVGQEQFWHRIGRCCRGYVR